MGKIYIEGLQLQALIGVFDFEREAPQRIVVDVHMQTDLSKAAESDDINDTINYKSVCDGLQNIAEQSKFFLLEALGNHMLDFIFREFDVSQATLKISKPDIIANADNVAIELSREVK